MKKAIWIPAIILLFFIGDRVGAFVLKKLLEQSQFRYSRLYTGQSEADLLFLGNSRGLIFYQPYIESQTGKTTINLSYNGMPIDLGRALLEDYYDKYPAPSTLIVEVTMCDRINESLNASYALYSPYSKRIGQLIKEQSPKVFYASKLSQLFRYNSEVFQRSMRYLAGDDEDWIVDRIISPNMVANIETEPDYRIAGDEQGYMEAFPYLLDQLNRIINLAQEKGTTVKLVVNPYFIPFANKMLNLEEFIKKIEESTGLTVHNYAKAIKETKGFGDYQHLNKAGSKKFIDLMIKDKLFY